jgi:hypothetical protein
VAVFKALKAEKGTFSSRVSCSNRRKEENGGTQQKSPTMFAPDTKAKMAFLPFNRVRSD